MQKINIMGIRSKVILNRNGNSYLVMESITEKEEQELDTLADLEQMRYIVDNKYIVNSESIFLYGQINLNDKNDINLILKSHIITPEINNAANIPSNLDYETGDVYADKDGIYKCHDTWNKIDWFKFNHVLLGKPERVIIYKIVKQYVPRNRSTR